MVHKIKFKIKLMMVSVVSIALFCSCVDTIKIKDGTIPGEYRELAKPLTGKFKGYFDNISPGSHSVEVELVLDESGKLRLIPSSDLLGSCDSKVLDLYQIEIKKDKDASKKKMLGGSYGFDPASCRVDVEGRSLEIDFRRTKEDQLILKMSIFKELRSRENCHLQYSHGSYEWRCQTEWTQVYLSGEAARSGSDYLIPDWLKALIPQSILTFKEID